VQVSVMGRQLDILALEPFYGGARRAMLETIVRCSRHRWTVLKLPPRRIDRRLVAAANWFSEQLSRHWVGRVDLLFTSEALNLPALYELMPSIKRYPSVVYFHDNQLPDLSVQIERPTDMVNLDTAMAATEVWFNSAYHRRTFLIRAEALFDRHIERYFREPYAHLKAKSRLMPPPVDLGMVQEVRSQVQVQRNPRAIFVETRDADIPMLNTALGMLRNRIVPFTTITVGPVDDLSQQIPRWTIAEHDDAGQIRGMLEAGVVLSVKPEAASDYQVIRALVAGCRPVLPDSATYPEILPTVLHKLCLYDVNPDSLADALQNAVSAPPDSWRSDGFRAAFKHFEAITSCRSMDERLEQVVGAHPVTT
jgi:hypothetical protein